MLGGLHSTKQKAPAQKMAGALFNIALAKLFCINTSLI